VIAILTVVFVWILILFLSFSYMLIFAPLMFTYVHFIIIKNKL